MISLNITSLPKRIDELRVLLDKSPIDVLAINETRLDSSISDGEMHISNYVLVRRDRSLNGRFGGGVFWWGFAFTFVKALITHYALTFV